MTEFPCIESLRHWRLFQLRGFVRETKRSLCADPLLILANPWCQ